MYNNNFTIPSLLLFLDTWVYLELLYKTIEHYAWDSFRETLGGSNICSPLPQCPPVRMRHYCHTSPWWWGITPIPIHDDKTLPPHPPMMMRHYSHTYLSWWSITATPPHDESLLAYPPMMRYYSHTHQWWGITPIPTHGNEVLLPYLLMTMRHLLCGYFVHE